MTDNIVDFQQAKAEKDALPTLEERMYMIATQKLYTLTTPPAERELAAPPELKNNPMWRQILGLDKPMGTEEEIAQARKEWLDTMPKPDLINYWIEQAGKIEPKDRAEFGAYIFRYFREAFEPVIEVLWLDGDFFGARETPLHQ